MQIITDILLESWKITVESAPYVLFGFFIAGMLKAFLPAGLVARHLGKGRYGPVFKAALFGVPLPLCSCGVIPAAAGLRQQGASKGATTSFLISTPETGVDSIAITWALLDPIMTVVRPVSAFITAVVAGIMVDLFPGRKKGQAASGVTPVSPEPALVASGCGCGHVIHEHAPEHDCCEQGEPCSCSCNSVRPGAHAETLFDDAVQNVHGGAAHGSHGGVAQNAYAGGCCTHAGCTSSASNHAGCAPAASSGAGLTFAARFSGGMRFAFGELVADIGGWLMLGVVLAAGIAVFIPDDLFTGSVGSGIGGILLMMVVGIPMYVCATASTPIAAAFALKGLSPGAALVFLLAGPATNVATITVVARLLGRRAATIYVGVIAVTSVLLGLAVNALYFHLGLNVSRWVEGSAEADPGTFSVMAALLLLFLVGYQWVGRARARLRGEAAGCCGGH